MKSLIVNLNEARAGDIVLFKGSGPLFQFFSFLLCLFEPDWRKLEWKPWHMAIFWERCDGGWLVAEGHAPVSRLYFYNNATLKNCRIYRRLERPPTIEERVKFIIKYLGKPYDVAIYPWTMFQYFIRHYFNHRIPKLLDERYTCWEFEEVWEIFINGKSWCQPYDCPIILDFMRAVGETKKEGLLSWLKLKRSIRR